MSSTYRDYGYRSADDGWTFAYLMPHLRRLVGRPDGAVLDLGCGNGAIARRLLAEGLDVYGVDASESGIAIANTAAPGRFHVQDLSTGRLPPALADKSFEVIIATEVIEHLYDPRGFLDFTRGLMPHGSGSLILSTPYHGYLKNLGLAVTGALDAHFTALWTGGHIKFFSRRTLAQLLHEQGFRMTDFVGAGRLPWLWKSMLVKARPV